MSIAWASIAIILLLLPGIFFFIGLATYDRLSREIIRSSVISEVAMAIAIAGLIHFCLINLASTVGYRLSYFLLPLAQYGAGKLPPDAFIQEISERLTPVFVYFGISTVIAFGLGVLVARGVISGRFRLLVRHRWIYDIIDADRKGAIITAFVMTTIVEESKIIMYKGTLHDIFLGPEGSISYIILKNCTRYYMTFEQGKLVTSKQLELFGPKQGKRPSSVWDRLLIEGANIANVLFDSSPEIRGQAQGQEALDRAFQQALERIAEAQREIVNAAEGRSPQSN